MSVPPTTPNTTPAHTATPSPSIKRASSVALASEVSNKRVIAPFSGSSPTMNSSGRNDGFEVVSFKVGKLDVKPVIKNEPDFREASAALTLDREPSASPSRRVSTGPPTTPLSHQRMRRPSASPNRGSIGPPSSPSPSRRRQTSELPRLRSISHIDEEDYDGGYQYQNYKRPTHPIRDNEIFGGNGATSRGAAAAAAMGSVSQTLRHPFDPSKNPMSKYDLAAVMNSITRVLENPKNMEVLEKEVKKDWQKILVDIKETIAWRHGVAPFEDWKKDDEGAVELD